MYDCVSILLLSLFTQWKSSHSFGLTQAFLALLRKVFSSPQIEGLVLHTDNNCNDNVCRSPISWPSFSKIPLWYVFEKLPVYY